MYYWISLLLFISLNGFAQHLPDEPVGPKLTTQQNSHLVKIAHNDPRRATLLAIIPGCGQLYNRDYWKIPVVYLSLMGFSYTLYLNQLKYQDFVKAYKQFYDMNPESLHYGTPLPELTGKNVAVSVRNLLNTKRERRMLSHDVIAKNKDYWRRNRNISLLATGVIYTLSIVEANVAAHLKSFDVTDDLSFRIQPKITHPDFRQITPGLKLVAYIN